jgi:hypothetical protein
MAIWLHAGCVAVLIPAQYLAADGMVAWLLSIAPA